MLRLRMTGVPKESRSLPHSVAEAEAAPRDHLARFRILLASIFSFGLLTLMSLPPPVYADPIAEVQEDAREIPAKADTVSSISHHSMLPIGLFVIVGAVLIHVLFLYYRSVIQREEAVIGAAVSARDAAAERARRIEVELAEVRRRLGEVEPSERALAEEVRRMEDESSGLRATAARAADLEEESRALEELLEEAVTDLGEKESEIQSLQERLKHAAKGVPSKGKGRAADQLGRRLRTLYKNLEIDDRVIHDMLALRDENLKLRAEDGLKRLEFDPDTAAIRRKVGGMPLHRPIFELYFGGKGRIYYTHGEKQRFRVLSVGAKNTQKSDMEYLRGLPSD